MAALPRFTLPLLARELRELSVRRSTYLYRLLMALAQLGICLIVLTERRAWSDPLARLGTGRDLLESIVMTAFSGIYLLLPVLSCGAIADEKERHTLELLLLTKLSPGTIILEKVFARLIPMLALLLPMVPLLAIAYSFGGFEVSDLMMAVWLLVLASLQVIAVCVMSSAYCGRSIPAFVMASVIGFGIALLPVFLDEFHFIRLQVEEHMIPPALFDRLLRRRSSVSGIVLLSLPVLAVAAVQLLLARRFLITRSEATVKDPVRGTIQKVEGWLRGLTGRASRILLTERGLPDDSPLLWMARHSGLQRQRLSPAWFHATNLLAVLTICLLLLWASRIDRDLVAFIFCTCIGGAALLVVAQSAALFSGDRSRQTLDLLLTTPLTARDILRQKQAGVMQLYQDGFAHFLLLVFCAGAIKAGWIGHRRGAISGDFSIWSYMAGSIITTVIYLPMLSWLAVLIGLRLKRFVPSLIATLLVIVVGSGLSMALIILIFDQLRIRPGDGLAILLLFSPFSFLLFNEIGDLDKLGHSPWLLLACNSVLYGTIWWGLREFCLRNVANLLDRSDSAADG